MMIKQRGFTIIELMIATGIFSLVLVVILSTVAQVGKMYYKGVITSKTQEATRSVVERIAQELQYSAKDVVLQPVSDAVTNRYVYCIGKARYFYQLGVKKDPSVAGNFVLIADDDGTANNVPCQNTVGLNSVAPYPPNGTNKAELVPENMRLSKFTITQAGDIFTVTIRLIYGDDDLIDAATQTCKGATVGTQFCATSELTSTVKKRV